MRISLRILSNALEARSNIDRGRCGKIFSLGLHSPALLSRVPYVDFELEDNDTGKLKRSGKKGKQYN